jgi:hypothetical protein
MNFTFCLGKIFLTVTLLGIFVMGREACASDTERSCRHLVLHMSHVSDSASPSSSSSSSSSSLAETPEWSEGTAVFLCNGSKLEVRDEMSIHMMSASSRGICYADFSCGNLHLLYGSFAVGAETLFLPFESFLAQAHALPHVSTKPFVRAEVCLDFLSLTRHCKPLSKAFCVENS